MQSRPDRRQEHALRWWHVWRLRQRRRGRLPRQLGRQQLLLLIQAAQQAQLACDAQQLSTSRTLPQCAQALQHAHRAGEESD